MPPKIRRQFTEFLAPVSLLPLLWMVVAPAWAHDFWIDPATFRPAVGKTVALQLRVGQDFQGDTVPYFPQKFERYVVAGPAGIQAIRGVLGDDPAGSMTPPAPGLYVIGLHTRAETAEFDDRAEFEQYLRKEGLERNLGGGRWRLPFGSKIEEAYSRCAKALVIAGDPGSEPDRVLGLPLELIAETRPGRSQPLRLRLLYQDKPLEGALVVAFHRADPGTKLKARTGADGRVEFALPRAGVWLVTSVHMIPAPWFSGFDWKSFWASLTLERP